MTNYSIKYIIFSITALALISCSSTVRYSSVKSKKYKTGNDATNKANSAFTQTGMASYYADKFEGRTTASGEVFYQEKFTAAHRTLPFGTKLKITNLTNGKSVIVTVNDRGPFAENRIIDLSRAAAEKLNMIKTGIAQVIIEVIN